MVDDTGRHKHLPPSNPHSKRTTHTCTHRKASSLLFWTPLLIVRSLGVTVEGCVMGGVDRLCTEGAHMQCMTYRGCTYRCMDGAGEVCCFGQCAVDRSGPSICLVWWCLARGKPPPFSSLSGD